LSIARNLVELHGGTLTAASNGPGNGAELTVTLPLTNAAAHEHAPDEETKTPSPPLAGLRLLVVDDDDSTRRMLQLSLRQFGADVSSVPGAAEAFDALARDRYDVVVSDIGMPGEDGCSLLRRLRASGNRVGAIALTAYASETERERAFASGFQSWLVKPIDPALLAEEVRRLAR
jgi:CheY-like chemotaxis protein